MPPNSWNLTKNGLGKNNPEREGFWGHDDSFLGVVCISGHSYCSGYLRTHTQTHTAKKNT